MLQIATILTTASLRRAYVRWSIDDEAWGLFDLGGIAVAYADRPGELYFWAANNCVELVTVH